MFWNIEGTQIYVLGTVHLTNLDPIRLPPSVMQVFGAATHVIFELDLSIPPDPGPLMLQDGSKLQDYVSAETFARVEAHWARLKLPPENLQRSRPGTAALALYVTQSIRCGYLPHRGIDQYIRTLAIEAGKQMRHLESAASQMAAIVGPPLAEQVSFLEHHAFQDDVGVSELATAVSAWIRGDIMFFEDLAANRNHRWPVTFDILLRQRNERWVSQIAAMARDMHPKLLVVGALHMAGPSGLPGLLKEQGLSMHAQAWRFLN
jgi:hypothetical protein